MRATTYLSLFLSGLALQKAAGSLLTKRETLLNEFLAYLVEYLPDVDETLTDATSVITDLDDVLADLLDATTTENELVDGSSCAEYTLIFARGTAEPGNMGVLVGPPLVWALQDIVGDSGLTIQGVNDYSASVEGYLEGGDPDGSANLASLVNEAYSSCPDTKLIVGGYSQGCQIVHNGIAEADTDAAAWIDKVVLFGDPDDGQAISNVDSSNVYTVCHSGDDICDDGDIITVYHLTYAENVAAAAAWATS